MSNQGGASLHCVAIRAVALNFDGSHSGNQVYVTNNLMKIDFNPEVEAGSEVADKAADGSVYVTYRLQDVVKRLTGTVEIVANDPQLEAILTGGQVITSGGSGVANVRGYQYPALNAVSSPYGIGLEAWTHNIVAGQINATQPYQRWVFPRWFLRKGNRSIDINRLASPFEGYAIENSNYATGPMGDIPIDTSKVAQWFYDTTFPAPALGYSTATS